MRTIGSTCAVVVVVAVAGCSGEAEPEPPAPSEAEKLLAVFANDITVDDQWLYYSSEWQEAPEPVPDPAPSMLFRIPKGGGESETMAYGVNADRLVADETHVYYEHRAPEGSGLRISRVSKDDLEVELIVDRTTLGLAVDDMFIYSVSIDGLERFPKVGGEGVVLVQTSEDPDSQDLSGSIAAADGWVYWVDRGQLLVEGDASIRRIPREGGDEEVVHESIGETEPIRVETRGDGLVFATLDSADPGEENGVHSIFSLEVGEEATLLEEISGSWNGELIAVDDDVLWGAMVGNFDDPQEIREHWSSDRVRVVTQTPGFHHALAADEDYVYFVADGVQRAAR